MHTLFPLRVGTSETIVQSSEQLIDAVYLWLSDPTSAESEYGGHISAWDVSRVTSLSMSMPCLCLISPDPVIFGPALFLILFRWLSSRCIVFYAAPDYSILRVGWVLWRLLKKSSETLFQWTPQWMGHFASGWLDNGYVVEWWWLVHPCGVIKVKVLLISQMFPCLCAHYASFCYGE